ncbi:hypothetical protein JXA63_05855 [Candidatus Woesebacteria bacterium]|nr:hypothetical protein [Candidatus Woesebacteria bacterium]
MARIEKDLNRDYIDGSICTFTPKPQSITVIHTHVQGYGEVDIASCDEVSPEGKCKITGEKCTRPFITDHDVILIQMYTLGYWPDNQQVVTPQNRY